MIDNKIVGEAISELRKKQNLTQKQLANRLQVSDKAVSKWERGLGLPDISLLSTLCMVLDTDVESLLEGRKDFLLKDIWIGLLIIDDFTIDLSDMVFDKMVIDYLIGYFLLAGINDIYIAISDKQKETIKRLVKSNKIDIHFLDDLNSLPRYNTMLIYKSIFIYGQNITRSFQKSMERQDGITLLSLPSNSKNGKPILYDYNHKIVQNVMYSIETSYNYCALPIMFVPKKHAFILNNFDKHDLIENLEKEGILYTEPMLRGLVHIPLNSYDDIIDASKIVEIVQKRDCSIGDLEEICFRRGF